MKIYHRGVTGPVYLASKGGEIMAVTEERILLTFKYGGQGPQMAAQAKRHITNHLKKAGIKSPV